MADDGAFVSGGRVTNIHMGGAVTVFVTGTARGEVIIEKVTVDGYACKECVL